MFILVMGWFGVCGGIGCWLEGPRSVGIWVFVCGWGVLVEWGVAGDDETGVVEIGMTKETCGAVLI